MPRFQVSVQWESELCKMVVPCDEDAAVRGLMANIAARVSRARVWEKCREWVASPGDARPLALGPADIEILTEEGASLWDQDLVSEVLTPNESVIAKMLCLPQPDTHAAPASGDSLWSRSSCGQRSSQQNLTFSEGRSSDLGAPNSCQGAAATAHHAPAAPPLPEQPAPRTPDAAAPNAVGSAMQSPASPAEPLGSVGSRTTPPDTSSLAAVRPLGDTSPTAGPTSQAVPQQGSPLAEVRHAQPAFLQQEEGTALPTPPPPPPASPEEEKEKVAPAEVEQPPAQQHLPHPLGEEGLPHPPAEVRSPPRGEGVGVPAEAPQGILSPSPPSSSPPSTGAAGGGGGVERPPSPPRPPQPAAAASEEANKKGEVTAARPPDHSPPTAPPPPPQEGGQQGHPEPPLHTAAAVAPPDAQHHVECVAVGAVGASAPPPPPQDGGHQGTAAAVAPPAAQHHVECVAMGASVETSSPPPPTSPVLLPIDSDRLSGRLIEVASAGLQGEVWDEFDSSLLDTPDSPAGSRRASRVGAIPAPHGTPGDSSGASSHTTPSGEDGVRGSPNVVKKGAAGGCVSSTNAYFALAPEPNPVDPRKRRGYQLHAAAPGGADTPSPSASASSCRSAGGGHPLAPSDDGGGVVVECGVAPAPEVSSAELERLRAENRTWRYQCEKLSGLLGPRDEELWRTKEEVSGLQAEAQVYREQCELLSKSLEDLTRQQGGAVYIDAASEVGTLKREVQSLRSQVSKLRAYLEDYESLEERASCQALQIERLSAKVSGSQMHSIEVEKCHVSDLCRTIVMDAVHEATGRVDEARLRAAEVSLRCLQRELQDSLRQLQQQADRKSEVERVASDLNREHAIDSRRKDMLIKELKAELERGPALPPQPITDDVVLHENTLLQQRLSAAEDLNGALQKMMREQELCLQGLAQDNQKDKVLIESLQAQLAEARMQPHLAQQAPPSPAYSAASNTPCQASLTPKQSLASSFASSMKKLKLPLGKSPAV